MSQTVLTKRKKARKKAVKKKVVKKRTAKKTVKKTADAVQRRLDGSVGDWLARHLSKNGDTVALRKLLQQLSDPKQRDIVMEVVFETLDVVDRLAWLAEHNIPASVLEKVTDGES